MLLSDEDKKRLKSQLEPMATRLEQMANQLEPMATRLEQMANQLKPMATQFEQVANQLKPIANQFEQMATRSQLEAVETRLLTEFHKWASPIEARQRTHAAALRAMDVEMEALSDKVKALEQR
jgi:DNA repair ATPase RecN